MTRQLHRILLITASLIVLVALFGHISIAQTNNGRTAADFMYIGLGARPAGLGGAYTALASGAVATYWNPAGVAGISSNELLLSHFSWYQDLSLEQGCGAFRLSDQMGLALTVTYLNYGQINDYDASGNIVGDLSVYDWSAGLTLGYTVSDNVAFGITGKVISQQLDQYSATVLAADLGIQTHFDRVSVAAMVANVGGKMKFNTVEEDLPTYGRFGVAVRPLDQSLVLALDYEKDFHGSSLIRQGVEYGYDNRYFLRAGVEYQPDQTNWSVSDGLSLGAGLRYAPLQFDYAFTPGGTFVNDDLHRFSLTFMFGQ